MLNLVMPKKEFNSYPWDISYAERLDLFLKNKKKKVVVYIAEKGDAGTFRYRVYNMCQALEGSDDWNGVYFFEHELELLEKHISKIDVLVISRLAWSLGLDAFLSLVKKHDIPVVFDVDDLVYDIGKIPLLLKTLQAHIGDAVYAAGNVFRLNYVARLSDVLLVTNDFLKHEISDYFQKKDVHVIPNFLNREQIEVSEYLLQQKNDAHQKKPFVIGYFSGSKSHENDFALVAPYLDALMQKYDDIEIKVVGFMKFPRVLQKYLDNGRAHHDGFVDFLTLQKKIASVDVGIVPLVDTVFANCKSELKFFEASIVGTPTCASPRFVFEENIEDAKTGYLCEGDSWFSSIEKIYQRTIPKNMLFEAREYCLDKYSPENQRDAIESFLNIVLRKFGS